MSGAIALTGGMGMGKSTVAKMFVERGCVHFDFDNEVAEYYGWADPATKASRPPRYSGNMSNWGAEVIREFAPELVEARGNYAVVDRAKLTARVLKDPSFLDEVERKMAPLLLESIRTFRDVQARIAPRAVRLFDVPLLFESGSLSFGDVANLQRRPGSIAGDWPALDAVFKSRLSFHDALQYFYQEPGELVTVVVSCPPELQRTRCMARPGMTAEKFDFLTSRQLSDAEKRGRADYVIDTSGSLEEVAKTVDLIMVDMKLRGHG